MMQKTTKLKSIITLVLLLVFCKNYAQSNVQIFLTRTYEYEGGAKFTDTKFDGHFTKFGIILPTLQTWHNQTKQGDFDNNKIINWNDIRLLTWVEATKIYKSLYWDKVRADSIKSQRIANVIVDFVVNSGFRQDFILFLQKQVNVKADGVVGMQTIRAINNASECQLLNNILLWRIDYYRRVTRSTPRISKYYGGLLNRLKKICINDNFIKNEKQKNYILVPFGCNCLSIPELSKK